VKRCAVGVSEEVSEVILYPKITYGPRCGAAAAEARLHELAYEQCFDSLTQECPN
jgi:hypothetical protein